MTGIERILDGFCDVVQDWKTDVEEQHPQLEDNPKWEKFDFDSGMLLSVNCWDYEGIFENTDFGITDDEKEDLLERLKKFKDENDCFDRINGIETVIEILENYTSFDSWRVFDDAEAYAREYAYSVYNIPPEISQFINYETMGDAMIAESDHIEQDDGSIIVFY